MLILHLWNTLLVLAGSDRRVSFIRKGTKKLGLSGSQSSQNAAEEESEGCETVLKRVRGRSHGVSRYRDAADDESAGLEHTKAGHDPKTALSSEMAQLPVPHPRVEDCLQRQDPQMSSPCQDVASAGGRDTARRSQRLHPSHCNLMRTGGGADEIESQESLASEAGKELPFCKQIHQDSSIGLDLQVAF